MTAGWHCGCGNDGGRKWGCFTQKNTEEKSSAHWKNPKQNVKEEASLAVRACRSTTARRPRFHCTTQAGGGLGVWKGDSEGAARPRTIPFPPPGGHTTTQNEHLASVCTSSTKQMLSSLFFPLPRPEGTQLRRMNTLHQYAQAPPNKCSPLSSPLSPARRAHNYAE
jgi:hypothetical protein